MISLTLRHEGLSLLPPFRGESELHCCIDRAYEAGDEFCVTAPAGSHLWVQMDTALPGGEVYLPRGVMTWRVPAGEARGSYPPGCFSAARHILLLRLMTEAETRAERLISRNPADLRGETDFFPHCTANVETRGESVFAARNVIDGLRFNTYHGEWPYQSWGIGAREDAWCRLDFGREVELTGMALTLRADFPHDAWWTAGHCVLSDGTELAFPLRKTGEPQRIATGLHRVRWLRLERMVKSDDPSAFPSLRQWEVFGREA